MEEWLSPCFDAESMRATDRWAIDEREVPSLDLMEAAGRALAEATAEVAGPGPVRVVCGKGNNGGDGLVAARHLTGMGFEVEALLLAAVEDLSGDARHNAERLGDARRIDARELAGALEGSGAVVDAILGTGFEGEPRFPADTAIDAINACASPAVAADVPSGVNGSTGEVEGEAVQAAVTVTFHGAKIGHWIAPGKWSTGELRIAPIGIPEAAPVEPRAGLIEPAALAALPSRDARSTKFSSGQVIVAGGSRGLTGAVCMAATAAIRAGAGYATVAVPAELEGIFEIKLTEVMSIGCPSRDGALRPAGAEQVLAACARGDAVVLGPGVGRAVGVGKLVREVAAGLERPLVLDADGLNAHAERLDGLAGRSAPTVLTPHAGELARLLGSSSVEVGARRLASAREAARRGAAIVVLKGDDTIVTDGERIAINAVSAPGLATAGTGDVLSGVIAAFIARGLEPFAAACAAALAHARAGRAAADVVGGAESVIASDVIDSLPAGMGR